MQIFCTIQATVETNTFSIGILLVEFFLQRCHSSSISSDMILSSTSGPSGDGLRLKTTSGPSGDGLKTTETGRGRPTPVRAN